MDISQSILQETLNSEDIEGLLALGAPEDEYSQEAQSIAAALNVLHEDDFTEDNLTEIVRRIWIDAFGPLSDADLKKRARAFRQVAREIQAFALSGTSPVRSRA